MTRQDFDVVVAGGGMAGASVTAALADLGYTVLLAEPGLDGRKRLAGELVHPPGARDLAALGLLSSLERAGGVPVRGFAVWADPLEAASGQRAASGFGGTASILPYTDVSGLADQGLALEHGAMTEGLLRAVAERSRVSVWSGARVVGLDLADAHAVRVTLSRGGQPAHVRARLIVAADGSSSPVRAMAGIGHTRTRLSTMVGFVVAGSLPCPGFANVFVGPSLILAYQLEADTVRVMVDIRKDAPGGAPAGLKPAHLEALPRSLRAAARRAVEDQPPLVSVSYKLVPEVVAKGRLVLVGDAAGCCHPLTATGLSVCARDAIRLRRALEESGGDIPAALRHYARRRDAPQRTRLALATALYEAFTGSTPEMRALRRGLLRYWARSPRGRAVSMALLSTHESRMTVMAAEYARVAGYGLLELARRGGAPTESLRARGRAVYGLARSTARYAAAALSGLLREMTGRGAPPTSGP